MTNLEKNRTLRILNAAAAGKYGVLAAIAYDGPQAPSDDCADTIAVTMLSNSLPSYAPLKQNAHP